MIAAAAMAIVIMVITYLVYGKKGSLPVADDQVVGWEKWSKNKLYFDELYHFLFVKPVEWLSEKGARFVEGAFLHRGPVAIGQLIGKSGDLVRKWQTGRTDSYLVWMVLGLVGLVMYYLIHKN
jgi:NADH-quinone oxidoreductase subunit L